MYQCNAIATNTFSNDDNGFGSRSAHEIGDFAILVAGWIL